MYRKVVNSVLVCSTLQKMSRLNYTYIILSIHKVRICREVSRGPTHKSVLQNLPIQTKIQFVMCWNNSDWMY